MTNAPTDTDPFENVIPLFGRENTIKVKARPRPQNPARPEPPEIGTPMVWVTENGSRINGTLVDIDYSTSPASVVLQCVDGVRRTGPLLPPQPAAPGGKA